MMQRGSKKGVFGVLAVAVLAGCGGGGGGGTHTSPTATPKVTVSWPLRSRDLLSPSSALSVHLVLHRTDAAAADLTIDADRNSTLTAHTETYTLSGAASTGGTYTLQAGFYAQTTEAGTLVGTAAATVKVASNGTLRTTQGTALGDIAFSGVVKSAAVVSGQSVRVGASTTLTASAYDAGGSLIVVTPGSFVFAGGNANLTVAADGTATGVSAGSATVTASIDGITSPGVIVNVTTATSQVVSVQLYTTDLAYDAVHDKVYAAGNLTSASSPNAIIPIDPTTGTLGTAIPLSNTPTVLAISENGQHLYAGGADGTIVRLALPGGTVEGSVALPAGSVPVRMLPIPNTTDSFVVATADSESNDSNSGNAIVFDGLVARADRAPLGHSIAVSEDGSHVYGFQRFASSGSHYYTAAIGSTGLTSGTSAVTDIQGYGDRIHWSSGKVVADDGTIADPATGLTVAHLTFNTVDHVVGTVPGSSRVYVAAWDPKQVQAYDVLTTASAGTVSLGSVSGGLETATWCGANRIAIRSFSGSPNVVLVAAGLP